MARKNLGALGAFLLVVLMGGECSAQSTSSTLSPELTHRIEEAIRHKYTIDEKVDIAVSPPEVSDVPGYEKIVATLTHFTGTDDEKKKTFDFLLSHDLKTLAYLEKFDIPQPDLMSKIDLKGRPVRGNPRAPVTIVVYDDLQCPFCSRMNATLFPGILKEYGDRVKFVYKDYPLVEIHTWAMHAAVDANCLAAQSSNAYWDFVDYVHANTRAVEGHSPDEGFLNLDKQALQQGEIHHLDKTKLNTCIKKSDESAVRASIAEGDKLGVDSTPTFFVNGEMGEGYITEDQMRARIDRALAEAGAETAAGARPAR